MNAPYIRATLGTVAALASFAVPLVFTGGGWHGTAHAQTDTVPICVHEDCSDQPGQIGVWFDPETGDGWLSLGESGSVRVAELPMERP